MLRCSSRIDGDLAYCLRQCRVIEPVDLLAGAHLLRRHAYLAGDGRGGGRMIAGHYDRSKSGRGETGKRLFDARPGRVGKTDESAQSKILLQRLEWKLGIGRIYRALGGGDETPSHGRFGGQLVAHLGRHISASPKHLFGRPHKVET